MRKDSRGFSLIELLIVVAIILIIAAIAIPDLLKSRQAANQAICGRLIADHQYIGSDLFFDLHRRIQPHALGSGW